MAEVIERSAWLGHRWRGHGLDGDAPPAVLDDLLLLGVQSSRGGGAEQSLRLRADRVDELGPLVTMWSVRGAPHVHQVSLIDAVRDALAPGPPELDAVTEVAAALTAVVTRPIAKGEASAAVAERVSGARVDWCERCKAHHVPDGLFRAAGRQAQVVIGPDEGRATVLHPRPRHEQQALTHPRRALLAAYLRVNGPTTPAGYRDWTGDDAAGEECDQLGETVGVGVDGRRLVVPAALLDAVRDAPAPTGVVLVPPTDPYLRQVDRTLLVPDAGRRREVWKALSPPGALLVDGEVAGTWRHRRGEVTVTPFARVDAARRREAERSARLLVGEAATVVWC